MSEATFRVVLQTLTAFAYAGDVVYAQPFTKRRNETKEQMIGDN